MRLKVFLAGLAAATLAAHPIAAAAASRAAAPAEGDSAMGGDGSTIVGLGLFVAVVAAFFLIANSDDEPASP